MASLFLRKDGPSQTGAKGTTAAPTKEDILSTLEQFGELHGNKANKGKTSLFLWGYLTFQYILYFICLCHLELFLFNENKHSTRASFKTISFSNKTPSS